ncbi:MAG: hypothetical protein U5L11_07240 [Arhodomonas sp.]|nr:hypothetical protein [Arhodomonas sp.]
MDDDGRGPGGWARPFRRRQRRPRRFVAGLVEYLRDSGKLAARDALQQALSYSGFDHSASAAIVKPFQDRKHIPANWPLILATTTACPCIAESSVRH